jgi:hypothetical protein
VHYEGLDEAELLPLRMLLSYTFSALSCGFKYLGFWLKTGSQRVADWNWLITKIEKKIGSWCYRWLSLGGRYILLKSVLESQAVYWMAVELLPKFVIAQIRKLCFKFLWSGNLSSSHIHLCSWEVLSRPKSFGGWGIRDLNLFNFAMLANTLWNTLFREGIWHNIVLDKYLKHQDVTKWFRSAKFEQSTHSRIWRNLLKTVNVINHWHSWLPGKGNKINIGKDFILGLRENSLLSQNLLDFLINRDIKFLIDAKNPGIIKDSSDYWRDSTSLGLRGDLAEEWDSYTKTLTAAGVSPWVQQRIFLCGREGMLLGNTTVKNFYTALVSTKNYNQEIFWKHKIMEMEHPIKNKTFLLADHFQEGFNLGRTSEKRMGRTWEVCFMQNKF